MLGSVMGDVSPGRLVMVGLGLGPGPVATTMADTSLCLVLMARSVSA